MGTARPRIGPAGLARTEARVAAAADPDFLAIGVIPPAAGLHADPLREFLLHARPALAGGLYGLGAGLLADAGARLFCWVSDPAHVLLSHGGAILGLVIAGALSAVIVDRARVRV